MGTDIHPAVEVRRKGIWRYHKPVTECPYYYEYDYKPNPNFVRGKPETGPVSFKEYRLDSDGNRIRSKWDRCATRLPEFFRNRNYLKFAILADVRNGYGFAGVKTFDPLPSIAPGRGLPADITKEARAKLSNEHSETWVLLSELMAWPHWDGKLVHEGVISEYEFLETLIKGTTPSSWSGGISGQDIVVVTPDQYLALYGGPRDLFSSNPPKPRTYDDTKRYFVQYRWEVPLATAGHEIDEIITYMHDLIPKGGTAEDVRMVMDFDS